MEVKKLYFLICFLGGKSAILTAIAVCLGGKASFTNRGTSVSSLIKQGNEVAEVIVKIRNRGTEAYQHDLYGDSITVVRSIQKQGGGYKLKSKSGNSNSLSWKEKSFLVGRKISST
jgi:chromosome segregation ATPase